MVESKETGICRAPETYDGPCDPRTSFKRYNRDMKNAWEQACKAYFPVYALTAAPKLETLLDYIARAGPLNGTGPIGSSGTKYSGDVLEANGTIYLPSRDNQAPYSAKARPKTPDMSAREAELTEKYIMKLRELTEQTTDSQLRMAIEDTISELAAQGSSV
ncbi:Pb-fam-5 protein [Toxoplasma gondii TgCatPRC2]|uniref:Pb-fam-5 protein n=3 Tax=Toxoplasma gondii TaxID=5811 RepID=A0A151HMQ9_TOXGO|nr:Pb-fam-5 protein [Toxoplasma gondii ME49]EPT29721.1 Pb-fam-5 protein [Toxoplasma gondii ME49]KYF40765.1 Pb-fam-5 protein [Toxoplasma gondii ARI]KYK70683.1 Pb-fam-5 protein [Toxoplasma gondii TgCatPRC2]|eukprot:XP_002365425.1 Pb-fam-5 protein [Toxoplasma gondii ME49]